MAVDFIDNATLGADGEHYVPNTISAVGNMIGKVAEQIIREVEAQNPLTDFEKMPIDNGDTVEQAIIELASSTAYDPDGSDALKRANPSIIARYFNTWTRAKFKHTVDIPEIRKILKTGKGASDVATKVVSALSEGDLDEKYQNLKALLAWGRQDQDGKALVKLDDVAYDNGIDYQGVLIALKDTVKGMGYVNSSFNGASLRRKTKKDDIKVIMPYKLKNRIDVGELAGVFNLSKAELENKIIEIDTEVEEISGKDCYTVYVVDRNAILDYTRLYEMIDEKNADGLFWNYYLHVERMYGISQLFDGCYFNVLTEA